MSFHIDESFLDARREELSLRCLDKMALSMSRYTWVVYVLRVDLLFRGERADGKPDADFDSAVEEIKRFFGPAALANPELFIQRYTNLRPQSFAAYEAESDYDDSDYESDDEYRRHDPEREPLTTWRPV